jgi:hypothetical protein
MKFNFKKNWYYLVPVAIGAYLIFRQFSKKNDPKADAPTPPIISPSPSPSVDFPLQKGSKNSTVNTLQSILNVGLQAQGATLLVVDGDFGNKTLAALQSLAGKTSIANQAELDALRTQMTGLGSLSTDLDWGWKLLDASKSGSFTKLVVKTPVTLVGYIKNFEGKYVQNGKKIDLPVHSYSLADYKVDGVAKDGSLRIQVTKGALAGMYYTQDGTDLKTTFDIV